MTQGKSVVLITGASSGTGKTSLSGFSKKATRSTALRVVRMSDIEAATACLK